MYILGFSAFYHDSAACLLKDDEIIAAVQEERFSRIKNDFRFPFKAIEFCLEYSGISLVEVDYVVFYEKPFLKFERLVETYLAFAPHGLFSFWKSMPLWLKEKLFQKKTIISNLQIIDCRWRYNSKNLLFTEHHQAHAASAFFPSPFKEALILTVDGVGEWTTTSVAKGIENKIEVLKEIRFPHSIGLLYSAFTYYLGFKVNSDEYKIMGLAPYGEPKYVNKIYDHLIDIKADGSFRVNMEYFDYGAGLKMTNRKFDLLFGSIPRKPDAEITSFHMDVASSIQKVTEEIMLLIACDLYKEYGIENLCLAGGVALNCVANGKILQETPFKQVWIQPAAGDAGGALGAAYAVYYEYLQNSRKASRNEDKMKNALLGPAFTKDEVRQFLSQRGETFYEPEEEDYYTILAREIAQGKVIGWFKGRMEYGPRALGARSILGDARNPVMQSVMNLKIKYRESFRPFAPAILGFEKNIMQEIRDKIKAFRPTSQEVILCDPNINDKSTRLYKFKDDNGNRFKIWVFTYTIRLEAQLETSLLFSINFPDKVCLANKLLEEISEIGKIYTDNSIDDQIKSCIGLLMNDLKTLNFDSIEGLTVYGNSIQLTLKQDRKILPEIEIFKRLKSIIELNFPDKIHDIDYSDLPIGFRKILYNFKSLAITDDFERSEKILELTKKERSNLIKVVEPKLEEIYSFVESFGDKPLSEGAIGIQCLAEIVIELTNE